MVARRANSLAARGMMQGDHPSAAMHVRRMFGGSGRMEMPLPLEDRMRYTSLLHPLFVVLACVRFETIGIVLAAESLQYGEIIVLGVFNHNGARSDFFICFRVVDPIISVTVIVSSNGQALPVLPSLCPRWFIRFQDTNVRGGDRWRQPSHPVPAVLPVLLGHFAFLVGLYVSRWRTCSP